MKRRHRTDYGTIVLHWLMVAAFGTAFVSGLRIATEAPARTWINLFDAVLPRESVWMAHMQAAVALVAVSLAYPIYMRRSGLGRRIRLDRIRLRGLLGRGQARLGAVNVVLNWVFFLTMLALMASGGLLYFGYYAGNDMATLHWYGTWVILGFVGLHVLMHFEIGGASQLLRIFRPARLVAPPPRLDTDELLTMLVEQSARLAVEPESVNKTPPAAHLQPIQPLEDPIHARPAARNAMMAPPPRTVTRRSVAKPRRPRSPTFQSNPFVVAAAVAITSASVIVAADRMTVDHLEIHRIAKADAPVLDGDTSDRAWRNVRPFSLMTSQGGNFDDKGETRIDIRAVHDGTWAYFLFTWEDPTRSLKHLPLVKQADGWRLLHDGYETGDEHDYNEDKFSVLLTTLDGTLAGDRTFHASPHPIPEAPATMTGRGLHFTVGDIGYVDVWQWKATSGGPTGWMDDANFGPPLDATPMQARNIVPYKGGFAPDPGASNYSDNFVISAEATGDGNRAVKPRRLPRDLAATTAAMGDIDLDPNHGESEGARWFMTEAESIPYSADLDARIPVGTVIPGVILSGEFTGDRADVRCAARWASGHWALEVARRLDTHSRYDVALKSGIFMRVAAFDHSQIRHTRHVQPIRLEVE
ncbi:MAG: ethylbenzene dehydrogenase-related protein [Bradyrhizobium sp.]|uniref:ethylbenzene dehydrogenase-related protein n=1 Tax=Bradyrhizobium sp. TaxID=376 RepID=UPI003C7E89EF